jgi:hypothetical protein
VAIWVARAMVPLAPRLCGSAYSALVTSLGGCNEPLIFMLTQTVRDVCNGQLLDVR